MSKISTITFLIIICRKYKIKIEINLLVFNRIISFLIFIKSFYNLSGKHLGMFVDRSKVEVDGGLDIRVSYDDSGDG